MLFGIRLKVILDYWANLDLVISDKDLDKYLHFGNQCTVLSIGGQQN